MNNTLVTLIAPCLYMFVIYKLIVYFGDSVLGGW